MAESKFYRWSLLTTSVLMATGLAVPAAFAQSGPQADEIVVTAQRREEALRDVPVSVAAMDAETLDQLGIDDLKDVTGQVPNLFVNNFNGRPDTVRLFIRGLGQNDVSLTQDPSVALYIDNVYVGSSIGGSFDSLDLERVEILRGPQGTLYGRNATGGAVNLISRRPDLEEFSVHGAVTAGNYNLIQTRVGVNVPVGENFAANVIYGTTERDGWVENNGAGEDWGTQDRENFRGALRFAPSSNFEINYSYDWSHVQDSNPFTGPTQFTPGLATGTGIAFLSAPVGTIVPTVALVQFTDPLPLSEERPDEATALQAVTPVDSEISGHALQAEWDVNDNLTLRSITGVRNIEADFRGDYMYTAQGTLGSFDLLTNTFTPFGLPPGSVGGQNIQTEFESFTQEFQALGSFEGFGSTVRYVGGLYYYTQEGSQRQASVFITPRGGAEATIDDSSIAVFTELTFLPHAFDEQLEISVGARYSEDERNATRTNESSVAFAALGGFTAANCADPVLGPTIVAVFGSCVPTGVVQAAEYSQEFDNFSPSLSLTWNFNDTSNMYFRYAQGYKTGGTSERSANPVLFSEGYQPEEITSYEIGLKGLFFDRRLAFNIAAFMMELDAFQTSVQTGSTPGDRDFIGIDGNEFRGIEADAQFALTESLSLVASYGMLETEVGETTVTYLNSTGGTVVASLISEFPFAPEKTITLGLTYDRDLNNGFSLSGAINYAYQSSTQTSLNVFENTSLDQRGVVDGSVTLRRNFDDGDRELAIKLWGRNIFDEDYRVVDNRAFAFIGAARQAEWGEPQTYGVTLSFTY